MKNILIVLPNDSLGGAEQYLKMVAEYFNCQGYFVDVYFLKKSRTHDWESNKSNSFRVFYTNYDKEKFGLVHFLVKLLRNKKGKYHYIFTSHVHLNSLVATLRKVGLLQAENHIARESTSVFKRFTGLKLFAFKLLYNLNYDNIDLLICQTEYMRNQIIEALPNLSRKMKIKTIPNPIKLSTDNNKELLRDELLDKYIVSAGRLIPEKGFDILIESFNKLRKEFPNINLVILGEGLMRSDLEKKILALKLEDSVFLPGFVNNVYSYFKNAELCVVSSRIEGFPNVLLQMMSQNDKVVSTLCAGDIDKLEGVYTCLPDNINLLYRSMKECLEKDSTENRIKFDEELKKRSIGKFIELIEESL